MDNSKNVFLNVEYHPDFTGGDYSGPVYNQFLSQENVNKFGTVEAAFSHKTGLPEDCIVFYTVDYLYNEEGTALKEDGHTFEILPTISP